MSKFIGLGTLSLALLAFTGCMGTTHLSKGINEAGSVKQENIVFPELDKAWQNQGMFPNSENLEKIKPGIDKNELYQLIGRPHFSEGNFAHEWDYIMKFYMPDDSVKICQYKVIFDKNYKGQEFYWLPADCPPKKIGAVQPSPILTAVPVQAPVVPPIVKERIDLGADALFKFDRWEAENMLPQGKRELNDLTDKLRDYQQRGDSKVIITGHTDRKGDEAYNMNLSLLRAQTVRNYLINKGINPNIIVATGAGESQPIKQCSTNLPRQQEVDCFQSNRRVTIDVNVNNLLR